MIQVNDRVQVRPGVEVGGRSVGCHVGVVVRIDEDQGRQVVWIRLGHRSAPLVVPAADVRVIRQGVPS